ncbi:MAG: hypothetical protein KY432_10990 [Acidobacteria bacterium]|nr:hypothetical protein [Acidobacteriota bacterium]
MLIVLIPMVSVAVVLFRLIADNEAGKADVRLGARYGMVSNLYRQAAADAQRVAREEVVGDARFAAALRDGDLEEAGERAEGLAARRSIERIVLVDDGEVVLDEGQEDAIAPATAELEGGFGRLQVSVTRAAGFTRRVKRLVDPGVDLVVRADDRLRSVPVAILTTSSAEADVVRTYDLGANSFITKPVDFASMVDIMREIGRYWIEIVELPPDTR